MGQSERNTIRLHIDDDDTREQIKVVLDELEARLEIPALGSVLFHVLMELVTNAVKANLKRAYFHKNGHSFDDKASYENGLQAFKATYPELDKNSFVEALDELDLVVTIDTDLDHDRLVIHVQNNTSLYPAEEQRIREKLSLAMEAKKLMDFYTYYGDDTEGHGLGLAMVVLLIKRLGYDPKHFRVFLKDGRTVARLEFPLHADYTPIRNKIDEQKNP